MKTLYSYIFYPLYSTIHMIEIQTYCRQQPIQWLGKEGQHLLACFACSIQHNLELHAERQLLHSLIALHSVEPSLASCKLLHACSIPIQGIVTIKYNQTHKRTSTFRTADFLVIGGPIFITINEYGIQVLLCREYPCLTQTWCHKLCVYKFSIYVTMVALNMDSSHALSGGN